MGSLPEEEVIMSGRLSDQDRVIYKLSHLTENEVEEVLNFISRMERKKVERPSSKDNTNDDDLSAGLISAKENCRARQVFEWESIRRRAESRRSQGFGS